MYDLIILPSIDNDIFVNSTFAFFSSDLAVVKTEISFNPILTLLFTLPLSFLDHNSETTKDFPVNTVTSLKIYIW